MRTVTLIRHAETIANAEVRWQGSLDAELSERGWNQVSRLRARLDGFAPSRLVASDLGRTMHTAGAIGSPEADPRWREFDVGAWEGLTSDEVRQRFPGQLEALIAGEDVSLGGGERLSAFRARVLEAFTEAVDALDDGEDVAIVTHGGVIWAVLSDILGHNGNAPLIPSYNTGITRVRIDDGGNRQIAVFNDATHLDWTPRQFGPQGKIVTVVRHGETEGNISGRWQGRTDSPLTALGREQVRASIGAMPAFDALYASPLGRAQETAQILAQRTPVEPAIHEGLTEMAFGAWEDMTVDEAKEHDPALFEAIYVNGEDRPRGGDGESFGEAGERLASALADIVERSNGSTLGIVSHAAAIRAYVAGVAGLAFGSRNRLPIPRNASMSSVIFAEEGTLLASYNVAPHLD